MGKYSSDEDRRRSRRDRNERRRRSRSRSRSRIRSPGRRRKERRRRSRSRDSRSRRSRNRHDRRSSKHRRQHRSSSKSRSGRHHRSRSRSRSRSRKHRSQSSSYDRRKTRDRSMSSSSESSSRSGSSSRHKDSGKDDVKKDPLGTQDSSSYFPSADALAKIESDGFVAEAFVSHNSSKGENGESALNSHEKSHEDAMFGTSGSRISSTITNVKSNNVHVQLSGKKSGIMASLLHEREDVKNDRWMKKLQSMREKKLSNT